MAENGPPALRPPGPGLRGLDDMRDRVRGSLELLFGGIQLIADAMVAERRCCLATGQELTARRLTALQDLIRSQLDRHPAADGAGVVVQPGLLADRERHQEWWHRDAAGYSPLRLNFDPTSVDLYDYLDMEWFTVPREQSRRCVYGPYIDYSGADHYILTMTVPVVDDEFLGVAGADVLMSRFEPDLLAILRRARADAVLVSAERRVIAANTSRWVLGSKLAQRPRAGDGIFEAAGEVGADSGWLLGVARPE